MKASNSTENSTHTALTVRVVAPPEVKWFDTQLATHHYLGAGRPLGDYLRQIVERDGQAVTSSTLDPLSKRKTLDGPINPAAHPDC
jgi:hypothetical protein